MQLILAIVLGVAFGATLDRIGASNPDWIGRMLSLKHLHLMKTILLAIGLGSVLMFGGQIFGFVDVGHMSVKAAYTGVFIGGLLGAAAYMVTYPFWKTTGLLDDIAGGKVTLGSVPGTEIGSIWAMRGDILGIVLGLGFIAVAFALPDRPVKTVSSTELHAR